MVSKCTIQKRFFEKSKFCLIFILSCLFFLFGCEFFSLKNFSPRGDWKLEIAPKYYLFRANSKSILLTFKEEGDVSYRPIVDLLFVTAYQTYDNYILVEGIPHQNTLISNEELEERRVVYYLIEVKASMDENPQKAKKGPFSTIEEFVEFCETQNIFPEENWIETEELEKNY